MCATHGPTSCARTAAPKGADAASTHVRRREALQTAVGLVLGLQAQAPAAHAKSFQEGMSTCVGNPRPRVDRIFISPAAMPCAAAECRHGIDLQGPQQTSTRISCSQVVPLGYNQTQTLRPKKPHTLRSGRL